MADDNGMLLVRFDRRPGRRRWRHRCEQHTIVIHGRMSCWGQSGRSCGKLGRRDCWLVRRAAGRWGRRILAGQHVLKRRDLVGLAAVQLVEHRHCFLTDRGFIVSGLWS